ncbi:MAG: hypothetical protein VX686_02725, partial [Candidatus Thermoplasmatota archaeon]|nr:hypothetical protein [Candidatus Thermoplasmatota archaeon]
MAGRGIAGLLQVLVACDVLSYKALTVLTDADFAHIFTLAVEQGFEAKEVLLLVDLHVEARNNTRPCNHQPADHQPADHHYDWCGAPPPGLGGLEPVRAVVEQFLLGVPVYSKNDFCWARVVIGMLGKSDIERALLCSARQGKHGLLTSVTLTVAVDNVTCQHYDLRNLPKEIRCLRGCVRAFMIVSELASRDGWKHSPCPCAAAVRSASPTLR